MNPNSTNGERHDLHIESITPMPTPGQLKAEYPLSDETFKNVVAEARATIRKILAGEDQRIIVIVGPCSVHSTDEALQYAKLLAPIAKKYADRLCIVMRVCLDKPRTGRAWPGFHQDPDLNGSFNFHHGWRRGRELMIKILELGLPIAMEFLDADSVQNLDDCLSYVWLGARTATSPRLRQIASGMSTAVGFKNPLDGDLQIAIDAIEFARQPSAFIAPNENGVRCEYRSTGHPWGHLVLRGTNNGPNFSAEYVSGAVHRLASDGLLSRVIVDASHGNSDKDHTKQKSVIRDIVRRMAEGDHMAGFMYESYLQAGKQKLPKDLSYLKPGISVTDGCDDWETTAAMLDEVYRTLAPRFSEPTNRSSKSAYSRRHS